MKKKSWYNNWKCKHLTKRRVLDFFNRLSVIPISEKFGMDRGIPVDRVYIDDFFDE